MTTAEHQLLLKPNRHTPIKKNWKIVIAHCKILKDHQLDKEFIGNQNLSTIIKSFKFDLVECFRYGKKNISFRRANK